MANTKDREKILPNYKNILDKEIIPKYLRCKNISVDFKKTDSDKSLWKKHDDAINNSEPNHKSVKKSVLDLKIELASRIFKKCHFCENRCMINRTKETGICKVKEASISSEFLHMGEEEILIPSYTIFFSGCTFNCVFCQNWDISQNIYGLNIEPNLLSKIIEKRVKQGGKNVNWVGGEPTPNINFILETLKKTKANVAQIWNSNMYCSLETMKLLNGVIDLYLTDFKFGNNSCAERLSKVKNYLDIVKRNHKISYKNADIIIRHLVMPNHLECCSKPILKFISDEIPSSVVNIMGQYQPHYQAQKYDDISRPVLIDEVEEIKDFAKELDIFLI